MIGTRQSTTLRSRPEIAFSSARGFTLVEVMMAFLVSAIALLALLATSFMAYEINHKARLRDNARAVLRSFTDQFQRISTSENVTLDDGSVRNPVRDFFTITPTGTKSGFGLRWGQLSTGVNIDDEAIPDHSPLEIDIGPRGSEQIAYVTRQVYYVDPATGNESAVKIRGGSGFMLKAIFTITYSPTTSARVNDKKIEQKMSTLRLVDY